MAEQEKDGSSPTVVQEQISSRHKQPYRPTDLTDDVPDLVHKRSHAPAVPTVGEDLKPLALEPTSAEENEIKEKKESETNLDKIKLNLAKSMSSNTRRGSIPESVALTSMAVESRKGFMSPPHPIPATVESVPSVSGIKQKSKEEKTEKDEERDNITGEIAEPQVVTEKESKWSYDEEASGLPRTESRASRVSRAMRQLFCCGVPYEAPSEDNIFQPCSTMSGI